MELEVLQITSGFSRWGDDAIKSELTLRVVPADHNVILIGEHHIFCQYAYGPRKPGGRQRIDARIILTSNESHLEFAKDKIDPEKMRGQGLAGFAKANFAHGEDDTAGLAFYLFADEATIAKLMGQMQDVGPGDLSANVGVWGFDYGTLPDENVWKKPDGENFSILPITDFGFNIAQLLTTRRELRDRSDMTINMELLDSDDIETVKRTTLEIKEAEEQSHDPLLKAVKEMRFVLFAMMALMAILVNYARIG